MTDSVQLKWNNEIRATRKAAQGSVPVVVLSEEDRDEDWVDEVVKMARLTNLPKVVGVPKGWRFVEAHFEMPQAPPYRVPRWLKEGRAYTIISGGPIVRRSVIIGEYERDKVEQGADALQVDNTRPDCEVG